MDIQVNFSDSLDLHPTAVLSFDSKWYGPHWASFDHDLPVYQNQVYQLSVVKIESDLSGMTPVYPHPHS